MLSLEQQKLLLATARESIVAALEHRTPRIDEAAKRDHALAQPSACFVTLNDRNGDLRGCIGSIRPVAPLIEAVAQSAFNAAFRDPRFAAVSAREIGSLHIEISVLGAIVPTTPEDVVVGRDGLIISHRGQTGLLLPQVATDYGWDSEAFLDQTCRKAGLPAGSWRLPGCQIQRFPAEIFSEEATES